MPSAFTHGAHLIPIEEWEERRDAEKQERIARFSQGAAAITPSGPRPTEQMVYEQPSPAPQAAQPSGDWLEEQFAMLNQRFTE